MLSPSSPCSDRGPEQTSKGEEPEAEHDRTVAIAAVEDRSDSAEREQRASQQEDRSGDGFGGRVRRGTDRSAWRIATRILDQQSRPVILHRMPKGHRVSGDAGFDPIRLPCPIRAQDRQHLDRSAAQP